MLRVSFIRMLRAASVLILLFAFAPTADAEVVYCSDVADALPWGHPVDPKAIAHFVCGPVDPVLTKGYELCLIPPDIYAPCGIEWYKAVTQKLPPID